MSDDVRPEWLTWTNFPLEGDIRVKTLSEPVAVEPPRAGEPGGRDCFSCGRADDDYVWVNERWRVSSGPVCGLPIQLFLETRDHLDQDQLDDDMAAEYGQLLVRLDRAVQAIGGIGRVHFSRWGDGSSHFHVWVMARPYGHRQMGGTFLPLWADIVPPTPDDVWQANRKVVAAELARSGGRAVAT